VYWLRDSRGLKTLSPGHEGDQGLEGVGRGEPSHEDCGTSSTRGESRGLVGHTRDREND
jgi:hypothetical protein